MEVQPVTGEALEAGLRNVGLGRGDVIYVHSQLFGLGPVAGASSRERLCNIFLEAIRAVIGPEGTIVVPTFTTACAREGFPFRLELTPCDTGLFAEYIRTLPGALRSLHPINSVSAVGPAAARVCLDVAPTNYGVETPFERMLELDAKAVNLGFNNRFSNSWHHHAEAGLGLPYLYNKLLSIEVTAQGRRIDRPFFATLRYLEYGIVNDLRRFDRFLLEGGHLMRHPLGRSFVTCLPARLYYDLAVRLLKADPWYMLLEPPRFRQGVIPWDTTPVQGALNLA